NEVASFVDAALRHHLAEREELGHPVAFYPLLAETYEALTALKRRANDAGAQERLDNVSDFFDAAVASFSPLFAVDENSQSALQAKAEFFDGALQKLKAKTSKSITGSASYFTYRGRLQRQTLERLSKIENLSRALADSESRVRAFEDMVAQLKASTSWRITAPLRWVKTLFAFNKRKPQGFISARSGVASFSRDEKTSRSMPSSEYV